jgi:hypothetical protein
METRDPLLHKQKRVPVITTGNDAGALKGPVATRTHDVIRRWAARRRAEPATGEATASGPASADIHDGGAGIRFNFPGFARFRPITWEEWFDNFERHQLTFVFEDQPEADEAVYEDNRYGDESLSLRYRIVKAEDWAGEIG